MRLLLRNTMEFRPKTTKLPLQNVPEPGKCSDALFLDLPIELRVQVYKYALRIDEAITVGPWDDRSNMFIGHQQTPSVPYNLARVCQQIHLDLKHNPVFYHVNTFSFESMEILLQFLVAITPARRASIRSIQVEGLPLYQGRESLDTLSQHTYALLSRCTNLRRLQIIWRVDLGY